MIRILMSAVLFHPLLAMGELMPMAEAEMGQVTGQEGIAMLLEARINADKDGNPLSSVAASDRRLAFEFNNREDEWLVIKDYYALIRFNSVYLDAGENPGGPTPYEDISRFRNQKGETVSPHGMSALEFRFPKPIEGVLSFKGVGVEYGPTGYQDDLNGSFLGLIMNNSAPAKPASLTVEGTASLFGF